MRIDYHISWNKNSAPGNRCPEADGNEVAGEGPLMCQYGCTGRIASLPFKCKKLNSRDHWAFGENTVKMPFNVSRYADKEFITIGSTGCCYVPGGRWNVSTTFSPRRRNDTANFNYSPRTFVDPVIRVQAGCTRKIVLPVHDPDGDSVHCRWATGRECASICNKIPGAVLDPETCTINYTANKGLGYKGVAIMMEDFTEGADKPFSSVAVHFFVRVVRKIGPCMPGMCLCSILITFLVTLCLEIIIILVICWL